MGLCKTQRVVVEIPADLSHTGRAYQREIEIDFCIADIVVGLQAAGINMRHSCCGHGRADGEIILCDGRVASIAGVSHAFLSRPIGVPAAETTSIDGDSTAIDQTKRRHLPTSVDDAQQKDGT